MKKLKFILEYNSFIGKKQPKLNEGGGAGKDFQFTDISYSIKYTYDGNELKQYSKEVEVSDKLSIIGYQDGRMNIDVDGLFQADVECSLTKEMLDELTIADVIYYTGDAIFSDGLDKELTLKEYCYEYEDTLDIEISNSGPVNYMHGAGWLTPSFNSGDTIELDGVDDIYSDYYTEAINGKEVYSLINDKTDMKITITLTATEEMEQLWDDIFNSDYDEDEE